MKDMPHVSIIILNWNGWEDSVECLESVYQITYPNYDVIVVDNGSENDSIARIKEYADGKIRVASPFYTYSADKKPISYIEYSKEEAEIAEINGEKLSDISPEKRLIILKNEKNYGFAEGNNIAIRFAMKVQQPTYILLLNNDTVVDISFLEGMVLSSESDKKVGIAGPKIFYYNYHGRTDIINFAGGRIDMWRGLSPKIGSNEVDFGQSVSISYVDYVEGSCLLAKVEVIEKVGLLEGSYFAYWEETDFCMRARKCGYRILYVPTAKIWHKIAASNKSGIKNYYLIRNRFLFLKRNATRIQLLFFVVYFFGFEFWFFSMISFFYHRNIVELRSFIKGVYDGMSIMVRKS
jgi:GT2 family glycosyltransferase